MKVPAEAEDLPPGAKLVLLVLEIEGVRTPSQLTDQTKLHRRTVHRALRDLRERDVVEVRRSVEDGREREYARK